jgi:hypothetical protein
MTETAPCIHCGQVYDLCDLLPDPETPSSEGAPIQCGDCKRAYAEAEYGDHDG